MVYVDHEVRTYPLSNNGPGKNMRWEWKLFGILADGRKKQIDSGEAQGADSNATRAGEDAWTKYYLRQKRLKGAK